MHLRNVKPQPSLSKEHNMNPSRKSTQKLQLDTICRSSYAQLIIIGSWDILGTAITGVLQQFVIPYKRNWFSIYTFAIFHDDIMTWKCFPGYWPSLWRESTDWPVVSLTKDTVMWRFDVFFVVSTNKLRNKQLKCQWFETSWKNVMSL